MSNADRNIRRQGKGEGFDAYYYGFTPTGCELVDNILKAVAGAGASQHNTDNWVDEAYGGGASPAECIQIVAEESAIEAKKLLEQRHQLQSECERLKAENEKLRNKWVKFNREDPNLPTDWGYYLVETRHVRTQWEDVVVDRERRTQNLVTHTHYEIHLCNSLGDFEEEEIVHYQCIEIPQH